jgi:hypothetical protein
MVKTDPKDAESNAAAQQIVQAESKDAEANVAAPQSVQGEPKDAEPNTKSLPLPYYCSARPKTFQRTAGEASARANASCCPTVQLMYEHLRSYLLPASNILKSQA